MIKNIFEFNLEFKSFLNQLLIFKFMFINHYKKLFRYIFPYQLLSITCFPFFIDAFLFFLLFFIILFKLIFFSKICNFLLSVFDQILK